MIVPLSFIRYPGTVTSPHKDPIENSAESDRSSARLAAPGESAGPRLGRIGSDSNDAIALPAFLSAALYLAFGLSTVFVQEPSFTLVNFLTGGFLLMLGVAQAFTAQKIRPFESTISQSLNSMALVLAGAAILLLIVSPSTFGFILIVSLALGLTSILKILLGMRAKNSLAIAKDWQLEGLIMTLAAAALVIIGEIGEKALLGTLGGGAIISGVFLIIGAFTLRGAEKKRAE